VVESIVSDLMAALCFTSPWVTGLAAWWIRHHYAYKLAELETRKIEAQAKVEANRMLTGAPSWLDPDDPNDLAAWRRARGEMDRLITKQEE
jgi:hypothetical protein